jgi:ubiquinone/menaquinone biosynthesis C-methylase UbiE
MRIRALAALAALALCSGCGAWKRYAYEGFGRDAWQKPDEVIALLELRAGDHVADIGAGGGYFAFHLADAVGDAGRVYAVDVDDDMIEYLRARVAEEGRANVEVIRAEFHDPLLPDGRIDLVFSCDTYHHLAERIDYFTKLRGDLAPGARVAILDFNGQSWFARSFGHTTPKQTIVDELAAAGYRLVADHDLIERQHFLVFEVAPAAGAAP